MDEELEDELDELVGLDDDELNDDDELAELLDCSEDDELSTLLEVVEDELDKTLEDELLDCSEDELVEDDELSELLDFSEVLDVLTELLIDTVDDEELESSPHAVKVSTTAAAVTALKIFLIFIAFFVPFHK